MNEPRDYINCSQCRKIVAQDETSGGFCRACLPVEIYPTMSDQGKSEKKVWPEQWGHLKQYGLTKEIYETMLDRQKHVCAICKKPNWNKRRPAVDHDHVTGKVRGLLCLTCNHALGSIRDNPATALAMAHYLKKHSAPAK